MAECNMGCFCFQFSQSRPVMVTAATPEPGYYFVLGSGLGIVILIARVAKRGTQDESIPRVFPVALTAPWPSILGRALSLETAKIAHSDIQLADLAITFTGRW